MFKILDLEVPDKSRIVVGSYEGEILFSISKLNKRHLGAHDAYAQVNNYVSRLSADEQSIIFRLYAEAEYVFMKGSPQSVITGIKEIIRELVDVHFSPERISDIVLSDNNVNIPLEFATSYVDSIERSGTREQTYLRSDYAQLVVAVVTLRVLLPIWGMFLSRLSKSSNQEYNEYRAVKLLDGTRFWNGPAMTKLRTMVGIITSRSKDRYRSLLSGISNEDFPEWMFTLVVMKRVSVGDIRGTDSYINLVKLIHKYVSEKADGDNSPGPNQIKGKKPPKEDESDPDAKLSVAERFKIKYDLSIGELATIEFFLSDPHAIARLLDPSIPDEVWNDLLPDALYTAEELMSRNIVKPQITLLRWIMSPVIAPKAILYASKPTVVGLLAVAQCLLHLRGHYELSILITSTPDTSEEFSISAADVKGRTDSDLVKYVEEQYPYRRRLGGKDKKREMNIADYSLDMLIDSFIEYAWVMTASPRFRAPLGIGIQSRITVPKDMKNQLIMVIKTINSIKESKKNG